MIWLDIEEDFAERAVRDLLVRVAVRPETRELGGNHQNPPALSRQGDELARLLGVGHERLLGQDMLVGAQGVTKFDAQKMDGGPLPTIA